MTIDETRDKLLAAALAHVPFDGWSGRALQAGAADLGLEPALAANAFPGGPAELLEAFSTEIDRRMREHVAFLDECYRAGVFLASGRQVPRKGGVILAVSPSREDLETVMRHDPFVRDGLASFEIVEFRTSLHHPALAPFADPRTRAVRDVPGNDRKSGA